MSQDIDLGTDAQSLVERLRAACLGRRVHDRERAERAVGEHLALLGVSARPIRWVGHGSGEALDVTDGFIAAWDAGQWLANQVIHRANDAAGARIAVQEAAESELKAFERAIRKEAEAAKAEAGRRTEICTKSNSDLARLQAEKAMRKHPRVRPSFMAALGGRSTSVWRTGAVVQAAFASATGRARHAANWGACAHVLHTEGAECPSVDRAVEVFRSLVDAVEAGVWLLWLLDDEVLAAEVPARSREAPRKNEAGWWINFDPAIEQLFKEKRCVNEYAMQAVPSVMSEEDWLVTMASGHLRGKSGLFVSTSSRVIFLAGAFRIKPELELLYASVTSVVETGERELTVSTSDDDFVFKIKEPQDMLAAIRGGMPPGPVEEGAVAAIPDGEARHRPEIERMFGGLKRLDRWALERVIGALPRFLTDEDELLRITPASLDGERGLLALTDSRLLFVPTKEASRRSGSVTVSYDSVTSASASEEKRGRLLIQTPERELDFFVERGSGRMEILSAIQERMAGARAAPKT